MNDVLYDQLSSGFRVKTVLLLIETETTKNTAGIKTEVKLK